MLFDFSNGHNADNVMFAISSCCEKPPSLSPTAYILNGAVDNNLIAKTKLSLNVWQHLALVLERNVMYIYLDASIIATRPSTHQPRNVQRAKSFIGTCNYSGYEPFIGIMDDFRIYYKPLSAYEILQVMNEDV